MVFEESQTNNKDIMSLDIDDVFKSGHVATQADCGEVGG